MSLTGRERYRVSTQDLDWREERAAGNVNHVERLISAIAGVGLIGVALARRSWTGAALAGVGGALLQRGLTGYCALYETLGLKSAAANHNLLGRRKVKTAQAVKIDQIIQVNRSAEDLYRFWRQLDNLPRVIGHFKSVEVINDRLSHWVLQTPPGVPAIEWDSEIINEVDNELIGWRSLSGSDIEHAGSVHFERSPDGRSTRVRVRLQYRPPGGRLAAEFARVLAEDPERMIANGLRRFKETMEREAVSAQRR